MLESCVFMSIGQRITELRAQNNISQNQLASSLGISRQAISKWENDQTSPDTLNLIKLADLLDTEVEYLATGVKPIYQSPPIVVNLVKMEEVIREQVVKKIVKKPVIRVKYRRNPLEYIALGIIFFVFGLLIGGFF